MESKKDMYPIYLDAFLKVSKEYRDNIEKGIKPYIHRLVYYGVKIVKMMPEPNKQTYFNEVLKNFDFAQCVLGLMGELTPREFITIFPIEKKYDGAKYGIKDYFYTMNYIKTLDQDEQLGDSVLEFLWEYMNWDVNLFNVEIMGYISDFERLKGKPSLMEQFARMNNVPLYRMGVDPEGNQVLIKDDDLAVHDGIKKKRKEGHLRLVK